jgi:hypothetical protein
MEKTGPTPIKDILQKNLVGANGGKNRPVFEEEIKRAWEKAAGKRAGSHSSPAGIKKGLFLVNVDSPIWIYQLNIKKDKIETRLNKLLKQDNLLRVRLRAGEK